MSAWELDGSQALRIAAAIGGIGTFIRFIPALVRLSLAHWNNQQLLEQVAFYKRQEITYEAWIAVLEQKIVKLESERLFSGASLRLLDSHNGATPSNGSSHPMTRQGSSDSSRPSNESIE